MSKKAAASASVPPDIRVEQVTFPEGSGSNLGQLLAFAQEMPGLTYDPKTSGHRGPFDQEGKNALIEGFDNSTDAIARAIAQFGWLMANCDQPLEQQQLSDIGWTINGLGDLIRQLQSAREQVQQAEVVNG